MYKVAIESIKSMIKAELTNKEILVENYLELAKEIPDKTLIIEEINSEDELEEIWDNYKEFLAPESVFPIVEILGGNAICVGFGENNEGAIYYHDFDFGLFYLDKSVKDFIGRIKN